MAVTTDMMMTSFMTLDPTMTVTTEDTTDEDYGEDFMCDASSVRSFRAISQPPLFWSIVVVGGLGNMAVVWVYLHFRQRLKTMTDIYLFNLAVADLLFLVSLPLWAVEASDGWSFGVGLCKLNTAVYKIHLFSSMLLLACISVDRYIAIVQTTKAHNSKQKRLQCSMLACAAVWMLAVFLAVPEFLFAQPKVDDDKEYCRLVYPPDIGNKTKIAVISLQVSVGFCLPFSVMVFCYSVIVGTLLKTRNFQKHKAMRVILAVVVVFVLTQLPYNCILVSEAAEAMRPDLFDNCEEKKRKQIAGQVLMSLAYTHACLNPFLYAFVGVRFRRDMLKLLQAYGCLPKGAGSKLWPPRLSVMSVTSDDSTPTALSL